MAEAAPRARRLEAGELRLRARLDVRPPDVLASATALPDDGDEMAAAGRSEFGREDRVLWLQAEEQGWGPPIKEVSTSAGYKGDGRVSWFYRAPAGDFPGSPPSEKVSRHQCGWSNIF
jgi:hypothetical protein